MFEDLSRRSIETGFWGLNSLNSDIKYLKHEMTVVKIYWLYAALLRYCNKAFYLK